MCSFCWVWVTSLSVISPSSIHLPTRFTIVHRIALECAVSQREYYQRVDKVFVFIYSLIYERAHKCFVLSPLGFVDFISFNKR